MLRLYDFLCSCGARVEFLVEVPSGESPPKKIKQKCIHCEQTSMMERIVSKPALYLGDRKMSPKVSGGSFDTMGCKRTPRPPEFKGDTYSDFKDFINTREYKEYKDKRKKIVKENSLKKKRANAMKKDPNLSIRHNPVPGDPSFK